jgi:transposase InsO family protein
MTIYHVFKTWITGYIPVSRPSGQPTADQHCSWQFLPCFRAHDGGAKFETPLRLNENLFKTIDETMPLIEAWRCDYNRARPHIALGALTPEEFANQDRIRQPRNQILQLV